ncbi:hypothetical protein CXB51_026115 [Gossypium anomalum]|uniref:Uncharacterized protein n=1 Tax=Gossypium anomalum TaxID=47600 RepID=A0A8J6CSY1_9ROSI|nr:hypothetical protein CXB51_026115 [Gossypium anomalum]
MWFLLSSPIRPAPPSSKIRRAQAADDASSTPNFFAAHFALVRRFVTEHIYDVAWWRSIRHGGGVWCARKACGG